MVLLKPKGEKALRNTQESTPNPGFVSRARLRAVGADLRGRIRGDGGRLYRLLSVTRGF